jgi:hypothetical protein
VIDIIESLQKNQDVLMAAVFTLMILCGTVTLAIYNITEALEVRWRRK